MDSVLQRSTRADMCDSPFPHLVIQDALEPSLYTALIESFPVAAILNRGKKLATPGKHGYTASQALSDHSLPAVWRAFIQHHVSQHFYQQMLSLFGETLRTLQPSLESQLGKCLEDLHTHLRFATRSTHYISHTPHTPHAPAEVALECQLMYNSPLPQPVTLIGPHIDRPVALYAGLLYCRIDGDDCQGGDLELYRFTTPQPTFLKDTRSAPAECVEVVKSVPYAQNTLVVFPHWVGAVHGVSAWSATAYPRLHINFVAELTQPTYDLSPYQTAERV